MIHMAAPRQMTAYTLNALKGWPQPAAVDYHTEFSEDVAVEVLPGSVVHLDSDGKYALGVGTDAVMPLFMFNGSNDPDVQNEGGDPATEKGVWVAINPTGQAMALVAVGAYELVSTAFVAGTYDPNDPLTSAKTGGDAGKLAVGTLYTDMVVGFVSRGVVDNGYGHDAVAFWPFPVFPNP
jgi:hypothetical protein